MLQSMTGYGKASAEIRNKKITVEIKSLNSKQFDVTTRIASFYREKEIEIRAMLSQLLERGKIEISLIIENAEKDSGNQLNRAAVEAYYQQISELSENLGIPVPADWFSVLLRFPDVLKTEQQTVNDDEWQEVSKLILQAVELLAAFREQEGQVLQKVFEAKISNIAGLSQEISKYEAERIEKIKTRLRENLFTVAGKDDYDPNRFEQELIFYIEKLDVNEEKVRLKNHLDYFIETMQHEKSPGKKLGFIAQEIGREVNTLGSKSNHSEMQKLVVLMKDELEQIKEQVLNVL